MLRVPTFLESSVLLSTLLFRYAVSFLWKALLPSFLIHMRKREWEKEREEWREKRRKEWRERERENIHSSSIDTTFLLA